ncbi:MAG TPA: ABC-2 family transporter protein [Lachnospiraceae bacterium]|nr:ABC-2 family transporter protein [Lachnospiraceae bacterium]
MRYLAFSMKNFINRSAYRFDHFMGIFNTCLQIFIFGCIYKALYGGAKEIAGVTMAMVTTNFILSLGLDSAFSINEYYLPSRIGNGSISNELLKPVNFKGIMLAEDFGTVCFNLIFQFTPAFIIAIIMVGMLEPVSIAALLYFIISAVLGFFVLWCVNFLVQTTSFWLINIWSITTIKNVFVKVLSGSMLPLWFMPDWLQEVVKFTPFSSIYFTPVQIYLGQLRGMDILTSYMKQCLWILVLYCIGHILWNRGIRKLVVQGG